MVRPGAGAGRSPSSPSRSAILLGPALFGGGLLLPLDGLRGAVPFQRLAPHRAARQHPPGGPDPARHPFARRRPRAPGGRALAALEPPRRRRHAAARRPPGAGAPAAGAAGLSAPPAAGRRGGGGAAGARRAGLRLPLDAPAGIGGGAGARRRPRLRARRLPPPLARLAAGQLGGAPAARALRRRPLRRSRRRPPGPPAPGPGALALLLGGHPETILYALGHGAPLPRSTASAAGPGAALGAGAPGRRGDGGGRAGRRARPAAGRRVPAEDAAGGADAGARRRPPALPPSGRRRPTSPSPPPTPSATAASSSTGGSTTPTRTPAASWGRRCCSRRSWLRSGRPRRGSRRSGWRWGSRRRPAADRSRRAGGHALASHRLLLPLSLCLAYLGACTLERFQRGEIRARAAAARGRRAWRLSSPGGISPIPIPRDPGAARHLPLRLAPLAAPLPGARRAALAVSAACRRSAGRWRWPASPRRSSPQLLLLHRPANPPMPRRLALPVNGPLAFLAHATSAPAAWRPSAATSRPTSRRSTGWPTRGSTTRWPRGPTSSGSRRSSPAGGARSPEFGAWPRRHPLYGRLGVRYLLAARTPAPARLWSACSRTPTAPSGSSPGRAGAAFLEGSRSSGGVRSPCRASHAPGCRPRQPPAAAQRLGTSVYQDGGWRLIVDGRAQPAAHARRPLRRGAHRGQRVRRRAVRHVESRLPSGLLAGFVAAALALAAAAARWCPPPRIRRSGPGRDPQALRALPRLRFRAGGRRRDRRGARAPQAQDSRSPAARTSTASSRRWRAAARRPRTSSSARSRR